MARHSTSTSVHLLGIAITLLAALSRPAVAAPPATTGAAPISGCASHRPGESGVIRTFCGGPGVLNIRVDGQVRVLTGGACETLGPTLSFNVGVVTASGLPGAGAAPDYVGLVAPRAGAFADAILAVRLDGHRYLLRHNHGAAGPHGGEFSAEGASIDRPATPVRVTGTYTC